MSVSIHRPHGDRGERSPGGRYSAALNDEKLPASYCAWVIRSYFVASNWLVRGVFQRPSNPLAQSGNRQQARIALSPRLRGLRQVGVQRSEVEHPGARLADTPVGPQLDPRGPALREA